MSQINDELDKLIRDLDNESIGDVLTEEEMLKLRSQMNPYGRTIDGADHVLTMSYTDLRKEYLMKLLLTSIIGFLNRACDEWHVPDGMVPIPVHEHLKNPAFIDEIPDGKSSAEYIEDQKNNKLWMEKRIVVKEFLEDMFQFNPDMHVLPAYKPCPKDPMRTEVFDTPAAQLAIQTLCKKDSELASDIEHHKKLQKITKKAVKKGGARKKNKWRKANRILTNEDASDGMLEKTVTEMLPPFDTFHRINHYYEVNYEKLRDVVHKLYCDKPDLETAVNPYKWHKNRDEADTFINKHKNVVIAPIYPCYSGKWNFIGPFAKVRESVRYFNENTIVLEEIMKQRETDEKLGRELLKKKVVKKKQENVDAAGPDDPAFLAWEKKNSAMQDMGCEKINQGSYANEECPEDAIQVDVFRVSQVDKKFSKSAFYTEAEAPTFMKK